ncbi:MAG TPA: hypothetical protein PLO23_00505, partial [Alphaproteobacteria bacterium]|nr:hypothetical protein [Alphaproteobacteria bacterium]
EFFVATLHAKPMNPPLFYVPGAHMQELLEQDSVQARLKKMQEVLKFRDTMLKVSGNLENDIQKFRELAAQRAQIDVALTEVFELVSLYGQWELLKKHLPKVPKGYGLREDEEAEGEKTKPVGVVAKL